MRLLVPTDCSFLAALQLISGAHGVMYYLLQRLLPVDARAGVACGCAPPILSVPFPGADAHAGVTSTLHSAGSPRVTTALLGPGCCYSALGELIGESRAPGTEFSAISAAMEPRPGRHLI